MFSGRTEIGNAWEKVAEETNVVYYAFRLNDLSFEWPIYAKLFQDRADGGILHIVFD